jgi:hypothetical protein
MGQWTEIIVDSFRHLGHEVYLHYHNVKPVDFRLRRFGGRIAGMLSGCPPIHLARYSNARILATARDNRLDLLFSIQGKIDVPAIQELRRANPRLQVVFWFGDVLSDKARRRVEEIYEHVDRVLLSYRGDYEAMCSRLGKNVAYFPFGVSPRFHAVGPLRPAEKKRFSADIAFVGTHYPERDRILSLVMKRSQGALRVWGRGWRRSRAIRSRGRLSMIDTLKVHHQAKISLNIHHHQTDNGFNMKFFEIPAAGGFQICEWQPEIDRLGLADLLITYRDAEDLVDKIKFFLPREDLRRGWSARLRAHVFQNFNYDRRLHDLIMDMRR